MAEVGCPVARVSIIGLQKSHEIAWPILDVELDLSRHILQRQLFVDQVDLVEEEMDALLHALSFLIVRVLATLL